MQMRKTPSPNSASFVELLLKVLLSTVQRLSEPIPLFVIAIAIIVLLAAAIGGSGLIVEVRILFGALAVLGVVGILVSQVLSSSTFLKRGEQMKLFPRERFRTLRECLGLLTDVQFRGMITTLLKPREQDDLSLPVTKDSFLSNMERWERLEEVEAYLRQNFPQCARLRREGEKNDGA